MRSVASTEYPETEDGIPLEERQGHLPEPILATLQETQHEIKSAARAAQRSCGSLSTLSSPSIFLDEGLKFQSSWRERVAWVFPKSYPR